ncbi:hypothetical protein [Spirillospora sp. CA-128828]|uniref:hypothetical protein n=1 Tax=Spirillospora sp. CA-128828 TaxID=3240033 RepID=UPI003D917930
MAYRGKLTHTHALTRPFVRRPINHANFTGRPEPNPIETGFTVPRERRGGSLHQVRLLAFIMFALGLVSTVIAGVNLRPIPLAISVAVTAFGYLTLRFIARQLR